MLALWIILGFFALVGVIAFGLVCLEIGLRAADDIEFYTNTEE